MSMPNIRPIISNTPGMIPVTSMVPPTISGQVATHRGGATSQTRYFPEIVDKSWQASGRGRFSLIEAVPPGDIRFTRGPRLNPSRGTVDCWVTAPASGSVQTLLQLGPAGTALGTDFIRLGVDASNDVTAAIRDSTGTVVAAAVAATPAALVEGQAYNLKLSWNAAAGTVALAINDVLVPSGDLTTDPAGTPWVHGVPVEALLDRGAAPAWNALIELVQISTSYLL